MQQTDEQIAAQALLQLNTVELTATQLALATQPPIPVVNLSATQLRLAGTAPIPKVRAAYQSYLDSLQVDVEKLERLALQRKEKQKKRSMLWGVKKPDCPHGGKRFQCEQCVNQPCPHGNPRNSCATCWGSSICGHGVVKFTCAICKTL